MFHGWVLPSGFRPDSGFRRIPEQIILPRNDLIPTCVLQPEDSKNEAGPEPDKKRNAQPRSQLDHNSRQEVEMIPDKNWKDNARYFQLSLANEPTSAMGVILNTILMIGAEFLRAAGYLSASPHRQSQINNFIMDKVHVH